MRALSVFSLAVALLAGCQNKPPHDCSGAAIDIDLLGQVDAGLDGGYTGADGGRQPKPVCDANCGEYRRALAESVTRNVPSAKCISLGLTGIECLPVSASDGCPSNTIESAQAIEPEIASYLAAEWPELGADGGRLRLDDCPCRIY